MLVVAGSFQVAPEHREEFLASREEAMRTSRREDGCLEYVFSADPLEAGRVVLYERWESKEALGAHLAGMRARREAGGNTAPPVPVLSSDVKQYEIAGVGEVGS
jgi:quinol monooxygenase YgiN